MAKLLEMNTTELWGTLVALAGPLEALCADDTVCDMAKEYRRRLVESRLPVVAMGWLVAKMIPFLLKEHKQEVIEILAVIEDKPVAKIAAMNGAQLITDAYRAWKQELEPFFTQCGHGAATV